MGLIGSENIENFIPQKHPFVLMSDIDEWNEKFTIGSFTIPADHILVENGKLTEEGLVEHMAQTAAVSSGYTSHKNNTPVPVGFIGQIKTLKIHSLPTALSTIKTKMEHIHQVGPISVIQCTCTLNEELLAECEMKIFVQ